MRRALHDTALQLAFRKAIERDGQWQRAQKMPERERQSFLNGCWQVFYKLRQQEGQDAITTN